MNLVKRGDAGGGAREPRARRVDGEPSSPLRAQGSASARSAMRLTPGQPPSGGWGARARRARSGRTATGEPSVARAGPPCPAPGVTGFHESQQGPAHPAERAVPIPVDALILVALVIFAGYLVFGITGFGASPITIPVLVHLLPLVFVLPLAAILDLGSGLAL